MIRRAAIPILLVFFAVWTIGACSRGEDLSHSPEGLPILSAAAVDSFSTAGGVALIEFGGKHCGPCKTMRGILRDYIAVNADLRVACVYWETDPEAFKRFSVGSVPAQLVFDASGKEIARHVGVWEKSDLNQAIESAHLLDRAVVR